MLFQKAGCYYSTIRLQPKDIYGRAIPPPPHSPLPFGGRCCTPSEASFLAKYAVNESERAVHHGRQFRIVRDDDHGQPKLLVQ